MTDDGELYVGFLVGLVIGALIAALVVAGGMTKGWQMDAIQHGFAHYDAKTGAWQWNGAEASP